MPHSASALVLLLPILHGSLLSPRTVLRSNVGPIRGDRQRNVGPVRGDRQQNRFRWIPSVRVTRLGLLRSLTGIAFQSSCVDVEVPTNGGYVSSCMQSEQQAFVLNDGRRIVMRQGWDGKPGHTGVSVWQSGKALADYMESLGPEFWKGKSVLELGCGTGLGSLTAHYLGAREVLATDGNNDVLRLVETNILENALRGDGLINSCRFRWGDPVPLPKEQRGWDLIIGSDLTYNGQVWIQLCDSISSLLDSNPSAEFLYCSAKHSQFSAELSGFRTIVESRGLKWDREFTYNIPGANSTATVVWIRK
mmetsp:Transcript_3399/g.7955  ORF Transcript_3399/g.7955 Transcript_3399/m.7955 type:complete len:306 (+) Transcript_3399:52-969(+)